MGTKEFFCAARMID